jgi:hypothetical protein
VRRLQYGGGRCAFAALQTVNPRVGQLLLCCVGRLRRRVSIFASFASLSTAARHKLAHIKISICLVALGFTGSNNACLKPCQPQTVPASNSASL